MLAGTLQPTQFFYEAEVLLCTCFRLDVCSSRISGRACGRMGHLHAPPASHACLPEIPSSFVLACVIVSQHTHRYRRASDAHGFQILASHLAMQVKAAGTAKRYELFNGLSS